MQPPPLPTAAPTLGYADGVTRWDVAASRDHERYVLAITYPWRYHVRKWGWLAALAAGLAVAWTVRLATTTVRFDLSGTFFPLAYLLAPVGVWAGLLVYRSRAPIRVEITRDRVAVVGWKPPTGDDDPFGSTPDWPRGDVYQVRYVAHSGAIVIRVRDRELFEFRPLPDPHALRWIAEELCRELGLRDESAATQPEGAASA
jgi:hypothetical protein